MHARDSLYRMLVGVAVACWGEAAAADRERAKELEAKLLRLEAEKERAETKQAPETNAEFFGMADDDDDDNDDDENSDDDEFDGADETYDLPWSGKILELLASQASENKQPSGQRRAVDLGGRRFSEIVFDKTDFDKKD